MILGTEVVLFFAVALAGFDDFARAVDAQMTEHVLGPAATVAGECQPLLGGQHAVAPVGGDMALEVPFVAEQAKPVLHLPDDVQRAARSGLLCRLRRSGQGGKRGGE